MRPADLRNKTWIQVQEHIREDMWRVHVAWAEHGPGTTAEVAAKAKISLLTFRPRTTDLYHLGLVDCCGVSGNSGVYAHVTKDDAGRREKWKEMPIREGVQEARASSNPKLWCACCGMWGDHGSGKCPTITLLPPTKDQISHAASILARARNVGRVKAKRVSHTQRELFAV